MSRFCFLTVKNFKNHQKRVTFGQNVSHLGKTWHDPPFSKNFTPRNRVTFGPTWHVLAMSKGQQF